MKRLVCASARAPRMRASRGRGYTIVELLTATVLTLMLMAALVNIFGMLGRSINDSRATLEMTSRLRAAKNVLQIDLKGLTVVMSPPRHPKEGEGYFEAIEGNVGPVIPPFVIAVDSESGLNDTTVGDYDDILLFTTRSRGGPFTGRNQDGTIRSYEAEVAWFVRGRTLYRRVLLVAPQLMSSLDGDNDGVVDSDDLVDTSGGTHSFHEWYDLSARPQAATFGSDAGWVLNTLGDLTKRENRFAHRLHPTLDVFPFDVRRWGQLQLPTLRECSDPLWMTWTDLTPFPPVADWAVPAWASYPPPTDPPIDLWLNPHPWSNVDPTTGTWTAYPNGSRIAEDVILTNVIGFDVKVWDPSAPVFRGVSDNGTPTNLADDIRVPSVLVTPGDPGYPLALAHFWEEMAKAPASRVVAYLPVGSTNGFLSGARWGAYVDMNYSAYPAAMYGVPIGWNSTFSGRGQTAKSGLAGIYDTWSYHYEHDGVDQFSDGVVDVATDGFDNNSVGTTGYGIVDDPTELETVPPYPVPLRGIQIKIRTFEPDSRQVREVTVRADFAPK